MNMSRLSRLGLQALVAGALMITSAVASDDSMVRQLPLTAPNGIVTSDITPMATATQTGGVQSGPCSTLNLHGTVALDELQTLLVNRINPGKKVLNTVVRDDFGTTCFSGNVAIMPCDSAFVNGVNKTIDRVLEVNSICPVKMQPLLDEKGAPVINPCNKRPVKTCVADPQGITSFCGDVGLRPGKKLLVNKICSGKVEKDEATGCTKIVPDEACGTLVEFSNSIKTGHQYFISLDKQTIPYCGCYAPVVFKFENSQSVRVEDTKFPGALVTISFVGVSSSNHDVAWSQSFYINANNCNNGYQTISGGTTTSCGLADPAPIQCETWTDVTETSTDVYLYLWVDCQYDEYTYHGCLSFDVKGCSNLKSIECPDQEYACED